MPAHKMVVVNGVRLREEDAPKRRSSDDEGQAEHKMRTPRKAARSGSKKND